MSEISVLLGTVTHTACFEGFLYPLVTQSMHTIITALPTRSFLPVLMGVSRLIDRLSSISLLKLLDLLFHMLTRRATMQITVSDYKQVMIAKLTPI